MTHRSIIVGVFFLVSCSSPGPDRTSALKLPEDLPKELTERFEVKDVTGVEKPVSPVEEPTKPAPKLKPSKVETAGVAGGKFKPTGFVYPNRRADYAKDPLWIGEKHVFEISYFGMSAGDFSLEVLPHKMIHDRKVYHFKGVAVSSSVFSLFYKINDVIESFMDYEGLFSHRFHMQLDESKQKRNSLELYDSEKRRVFFWNKISHTSHGYKEIKDYYPMEPYSQDSLSALMYMRFLPLPTGKVFTIPMASEGKNWQAVVTVIRREQVQTPQGKMNAVVLKPETKYQGVLKKRGDSFIWLSDDDRRFILKLEAKVKVGQVNAVLKKLEPGTARAQ